MMPIVYCCLLSHRHFANIPFDCKVKKKKKQQKGGRKNKTTLHLRLAVSLTRSALSRHLVWTVSGVTAPLWSSSHGSHPVRWGSKRWLPMLWEVRGWRSGVGRAFSGFKARWRPRSRGHSGWLASSRGCRAFVDRSNGFRN